MRFTFTYEEVEELLSAVGALESRIEDASAYGPVSDHPALRSAFEKLTKSFNRFIPKSTEKEGK